MWRYAMRMKRVAKPAVAEKNKFGNIKVKREIDGREVEFDSILEARFRSHLEERSEELGIARIERRVPFVLVEPYEWKFVTLKKKKLARPEGNRKRSYDIVYEKKKVRPVRYFCDFVITMDSGKRFYVDVKGMETPEFKIKKKIFEKKMRKSLICFNSVVITNGTAYRWLKTNKDEDV